MKTNQRFVRLVTLISAVILTACERGSYSACVGEACNEGTASENTASSGPDEHPATSAYQEGDPTLSYQSDRSKIESAAELADFVDISFEYPASWEVRQAGPLGRENIVIATTASDGADGQVARLSSWRAFSPAGQEVTREAVSYLVERDAQGIARDLREELDNFEIVDVGFKNSENQTIFGFAYRGVQRQEQGESEYPVPIIGLLDIIVPNNTDHGVVVQIESVPSVARHVSSHEELRADPAYGLVWSTLQIGGR
ncbi:hypothetical protein HFP51_01565 [Parasphingopyxis sp. CP4]|uniref:hypothetical protein n=1 Tax=Parasphingopyxis sp. CP4 TaxID=2724527 RepID=UPI0015A0EAA6|nr:hypothetical protein [Parasphingopyxis sp. CP4]QLC20988.1 hypothetical protein HFP51_01565 [Parasphingopyxis sp. CP4]